MSATTTTDTEEFRLAIHQKREFIHKLQRLVRTVRESRFGYLEWEFDGRLTEADRAWLTTRLARVLGPYQASPPARANNWLSASEAAGRQLYEAKFGILDRERTLPEEGRTVPWTRVYASVEDWSSIQEEAEEAAEALDEDEE